MADEYKRRRTTAKLEYDPKDASATPIKLPNRRGPYKRKDAAPTTGSAPPAASLGGPSSRPPPVASSSGSSVQGNLPGSKKRKKEDPDTWDPRMTFKAASGGGLIPYPLPSRTPEPALHDEQGVGNMRALSSELASLDNISNNNIVDESDPPMDYDPPRSPTPPPTITIKKRRSNAKREAKKAAWPRWREDILPSITVPFLLAEAARARKEKLPPLPTQESLMQGSEIRRCRNFLSCGKNLRSQRVQCVQFSGTTLIYDSLHGTSSRMRARFSSSLLFNSCI